MITKLLVRIKCPSWKVRRCSHAVQYIALFGVQSRWTKVIALSQGRFLLSENCFYQSSMVLEVSCSSTEAVKWPSNHTKFVKNVFIIIFSHQEGLSWQLHSFPFPVITFSFCAIFLSLSLCTDMPAALIIAPYHNHMHGEVQYIMQCDTTSCLSTCMLVTPLQSHW